METPPSLIELLFERVEMYIKTTLQLSKLKVLETASGVITLLLSRLIAFVFIALFLIFFSIAIALYLGDMFQKPYFGFLIVSGFYFVAGAILFFALNKWMKKSVSDLIFLKTL
jgi:hypothetical protein